MAVTVGVLGDTRRATLHTLCDTFAPSLQSADGDDAERAFYGRAASDLGVAEQIEALLAQTALPEEIEATGQLLDALAAQGFDAGDLDARTALLHAMADASPEVKFGLRQLRALTFLFFYGLASPTVPNPNWDAIGYPGPRTPAPSPEQAPKTIPVLPVNGETTELDADVCVVGSGAGGGVIAAELARAGRTVVVLEMGGYRNESDFHQLELPGMFELYLGGGLAASEGGEIAVLAGSTLGGGTVVNYMNCIRTPQAIRDEWAAHGIAGIDEPSYEQHIDAVWKRLGVNDTATSQNRTHKRLIAACDELGYPHRPLTRNADTSCEDPSTCGYCYAGCQTGCKQSTMKTYLQDAADAGAYFVVGARAERILTHHDRARGVVATVTREDGSTGELTVNASTVVVAAGAIESPALLLRSGIGGPAVGRHLRLHPAALVGGVYETPIEGWVGQIQSALSDQFKDLEGDWGFLVEATTVAPAIVAMSLPFEDGAAHKRTMSKLANIAPFISVARDHGEGQVAIDDHGRAVTRWSFDDDVDARMFRRAIVELARLQRAAGATEIITFFQRPAIGWREGEDFDAFLAQIDDASMAPNDVAAFTAHQMGSCRMGSDPAESVADGRGQLHVTPGVWIGDASAFPTAPGVNPMISIMSLAHRTAANILAA
jgi:choline dehydrogenase-like flavoprotein